MSSNIVLVTGATGFVGSWCVKTLLDNGHCVRATVRDLSAEHRFTFLKTFETDSAKVEFVQCDLLDKPEIWDAAMKGVGSVLQLASPTKWDSLNPEKELLLPTLQGTKNVLEAAVRAGTVRRVVLTSSISAVSQDWEGFATKIFSEQDWNTKATISDQGYAYSKVQAEKWAMTFVEQNPSLSLVVLLPAAIYGPILSKSTSNDILNDSFIKILNGELPFEMNISTFLVDVRDVALANVRAIERSEASGRYVLWSGTVSHPEFFTQMRLGAPTYAHRMPRHFPAFPPKWLIVPLVKISQPKPVADILKSYYGKRPNFDVSKAEKDFGMKFRDAGETIQDTTRSMVENEMCKKV